ncbi:MAG: hypothetical protein WB930_17010 [Syntrophobacteraceae bacterium]
MEYTNNQAKNQAFLSFMPDDAPDPEESRELEVEIHGHWKPADTEVKQCHITNCISLLRGLVRTLASKYDKRMEEVAGCCLHIGIHELWARFQHDIDAIKQARINVYLDDSADMDDRDWFDAQVRVELKTSRIADFPFRTYASTVAKCDNLAGIIGFHPHNIRQLALMGGLMCSRAIPWRDQRTMIDTIKRFREKLAKRAREAREIEKRVLSGRQAGGTEIAAVEDPWEEI